MEDRENLESGEGRTDSKSKGLASLAVLGLLGFLGWNSIRSLDGLEVIKEAVLPDSTLVSLVREDVRWGADNEYVAIFERDSEEGSMYLLPKVTDIGPYKVGVSKVGESYKLEVFPDSLR